MGHAIGPSTTVAYMNREHMRQKKDVVCGLLFLLHDSADRRVTKPVRNPYSKKTQILSTLTLTLLRRKGCPREEVPIILLLIIIIV